MVMVSVVLLDCQGANCEKAAIVRDVQQSSSKLKSQSIYDLNRQDNPMGREQNSPGTE